MWNKIYSVARSGIKNIQWPLRVGLPIMLLGTSALAARAIVSSGDLALVARSDAPAAVHVDQQEFLDLVRSGQTDVAFENAFDDGDELFSFQFNALDGGGANVGLGQRYTRVPRADLSGPGQWLTHIPPRETGPNAASCADCHLPPFDADGGGVANAVRDPRRQGVLGQFIQRNTPSLFAPGAIQRLAEEMTASLQGIRQNAINQACAQGGTVNANLTVQGISFGSLSVTRTATGPCRTSTNTGGVQGVATDLVVRPFQWKGSVAFVRDFTRGAMHNELGINPVEMAGDNVDGDGDGVTNELTIGDSTALAVYMSAQPRPTTLTELASLGLIPALPSSQVSQINQGSTVFNQIGCASCHVPTLRINNPIFTEPSQSPAYRDATFPAGQNPVQRGVDPASPISFDLTADIPENIVTDRNGSTFLLGALPRDSGSATNLALNKPATASSVESQTNGGVPLPANQAVDGNQNTRWGSIYSDPQWIRVDLGSTQTINRVVLRWETAFGRAYQIQTSNDGNNWTTIFSTTTGNGGVDDLTGLNGSGRFVRMFGTQRGTQFGYSLFEFEVFGAASGAGAARVDLFSDLKRHNMGAGLAEAVDEVGTGASTFLTETLWGLASTAPYLHDGRATTITEAILEHGGEAANSANNFRGRSSADQQALIAFLKNLVLFDSAEPTLLP